MDLDVPHIYIQRSAGKKPSNGVGDTNLGVKWSFLKELRGSRHPAVSASFYTEFPTGDASQQLGSGLTDYALNVILQKSLSKETRINGNAGILLAGNTSTAVIGTENTGGQVYTYSLSILHDLNDRLTLGGEVYGAYKDSGDLGRSQLQRPVETASRYRKLSARSCRKCDFQGKSVNGLFVSQHNGVYRYLSNAAC